MHSIELFDWQKKCWSAEMWNWDLIYPTAMFHRYSIPTPWVPRPTGQIPATCQSAKASALWVFTRTYKGWHRSLYWNINPKIIVFVVLNLLLWICIHWWNGGYSIERVCKSTWYKHNTVLLNVSLKFLIHVILTIVKFINECIRVYHTYFEFKQNAVHTFSIVTIGVVPFSLST